MMQRCFLACIGHEKLNNSNVSSASFLLPTSSTTNKPLRKRLHLSQKRHLIMQRPKKSLMFRRFRYLPPSRRPPIESLFQLYDDNKNIFAYTKRRVDLDEPGGDINKNSIGLSKTVRRHRVYCGFSPSFNKQYVHSEVPDRFFNSNSYMSQKLSSNEHTSGLTSCTGRKDHRVSFKGVEMLSSNETKKKCEKHTLYCPTFHERYDENLHSPNNLNKLETFLASNPGKRYAVKKCKQPILADAKNTGKTVPTIPAISNSSPQIVDANRFNRVVSCNHTSQVCLNTTKCDTGIQCFKNNALNRFQHHVGSPQISIDSIEFFNKDKRSARLDKKLGLGEKSCDHTISIDTDLHRHKTSYSYRACAPVSASDSLRSRCSTQWTASVPQSRHVCCNCLASTSANCVRRTFSSNTQHTTTIDDLHSNDQRNRKSVDNDKLLVKGICCNSTSLHTGINKGICIRNNLTLELKNSIVGVKSDIGKAIKSSPFLDTTTSYVAQCKVTCCVNHFNNTTFILPRNFRSRSTIDCFGTAEDHQRSLASYTSVHSTSTADVDCVRKANLHNYSISVVATKNDSAKIACYTKSSIKKNEGNLELSQDTTKSNHVGLAKAAPNASVDQIESSVRETNHFYKKQLRSNDGKPHIPCQRLRKNNFAFRDSSEKCIDFQHYVQSKTKNCYFNPDTLSTKETKFFYDNESADDNCQHSNFSENTSANLTWEAETIQHPFSNKCDKELRNVDIDVELCRPLLKNFHLETATASGCKPTFQQKLSCNKQIQTEESALPCNNFSSVVSKMEAVQDLQAKHASIYELLACRYPRYAEKITGVPDHIQPCSVTPVHSRPRDVERRRTAEVAYIHCSQVPVGSRELESMSDIEVASFHRGGPSRASMPAVRVATSLSDVSLGLVFLVYRDETKRASLPDELTSLDTVRSLFVRAFPGKLSLEMLESPNNKIYILEVSSNIFFQLEDLRDIRDRSVMKLHECDSTEPQTVKSQPEVRGRSIQRALSARPASRQGFAGECALDYEDSRLQNFNTQRHQNMVPQGRTRLNSNQENFHQRSRSQFRTADLGPAERPRSFSSSALRSHYRYSPECLSASERGFVHLNPIPEAFSPANICGISKNCGVDACIGPLGRNIYASGNAGYFSPSAKINRQPIYESIYPSGRCSTGQQSVHVPHSVRVSSPRAAQRVVEHGLAPVDGGCHEGNHPQNRCVRPLTGMSNPLYGSIPLQRSQYYQATPGRNSLLPASHRPNQHDLKRMNRMEAQIASLEARMHQAHVTPTETSQQLAGSTKSVTSGCTSTNSGSKASSLSDVRSAQHGPPWASFCVAIGDIRCKLRELRVELSSLKRSEQLNQEAMRDSFTESMNTLKKVISSVPGAEDLFVRHQRKEVNLLAEVYLQDKHRVEQELSDLEKTVEELKDDVLARKCRINISGVEDLALMLSNVTKLLADLKARYPQIKVSLKRVLSGEMEIVLKEEKFIKDEPQLIEAGLRRCKNLTGTLYTLKSRLSRHTSCSVRLATVQDGYQPQVPPMASECREADEHDKMAILESIRAMVPDHETRLHNLQAADECRDRKRRLTTQRTSMKLTKCLQVATKGLKPPAVSDAKPGVKLTEPGPRYTDSALPVGMTSRMSSFCVSTVSCGAGVRLAATLSSAIPVVQAVPSILRPSTIDSQTARGTAENGRSGTARSAFFSTMATNSTPLANTDRFIVCATQASRPVGAIALLGRAKSESSKTGSSHSKRMAGSPPSVGSNPMLDDPKKVPSGPTCPPCSAAEKSKKVPPPPPPRRSSVRTDCVLYEGVAGGLKPIPGRGPNGGKWKTKDKCNVSTPYHTSNAFPPPCVSECHPMTSTPKYESQEPVAFEFQKDPIANDVSKLIQASDLAHGCGQVSDDRRLPPTAEITTNSEDFLQEADLSSDSESTGSKSSLDSQQGYLIKPLSSSSADNCVLPIVSESKPNLPPHRQLSFASSSSNKGLPTSNSSHLPAKHDRINTNGGSSVISHMNGVGDS